MARSLQIAGTGLIVIVCLVLGFIWLRQSAQNGHAQPLQDKGSPPSPFFRNWDKPALAIVLTGQMHGYLQPCGCSEPQLGGMARRYNFLQSLKEKGWPLVAVDLGDLAAASGPQTLFKFETSVRALDMMNYIGVGLGKNEFSLPLFNLLGFKANYKRKEPPYFVASNLDHQETHDLIKTWVLANDAGPKVAIACLIGPSVGKQIEKFPQVKLAADNGKVIETVLKEISKKDPALVVLLYQGSETEARSCAAFSADLHNKNPQIPKVNIILSLEREEEPSGQPRWFGETMIIGVGHKSRNLGVVGVFPKDQGQAFDMKYQLVSIGPEWQTLPGKEAANPVLQLMEEYAAEVKNRNYMFEFPRTTHPVQLSYPNAFYVGSEKCGKCHEHAYKVWQSSKHSHAFSALVNAKQPSLRQFDGECLSCHTIGFEYLKGYADKTNDPVKNKILENVGCENCHGPGSAHVKNTHDQKLHALMNPFKAKAAENPLARKHRLDQMDHYCQKCHDIDNDVHWSHAPFQQKWGTIAHPTPPEPTSGKESEP